MKQAITIDSVVMTKIIKKYCEQFCAHRFDNLHDRD